MTHHEGNSLKLVVEEPRRARGLRQIARFFRGFLAPPGVSEAAPRPRDTRGAGRAAPTFLFAGIDHPLDWAKLQFAAIGAPRSGKSLLLKLLALSALQTIAAGHTRRAFFLDYKREYEPWLRKILPPDRIKVIEPFDPKVAAWNIAADIHNVDQAAAIGKLLAPTRPDAREPYFEEAVGALMAGVVVSLHVTRGSNWGLSDVVAALQSKDTLRACLGLAPAFNAFRIEHYLSSKQMNRDVLGTLGNRLQDLTAAARHWTRAPEAISLSDWMDGRFVLVVGHSHEHAEATGAITRALFERMSQLLLDCPDTDYPQSWLFLDELPSAGRLDKLHDLLSKGPSRGVVAAIGFQDIGSLRHVYGPDQTQALNSFLAHKAFLRISDPDTAEWASRHFGEVDLVRPLVGQSWTNGRYPSSTYSVNQHFDRKRVVTPTEFMEIPPLSPPAVTSLGSFIISPHLGRFRYELPLDTIERMFPREPVLALPPAPRLIPAAPEVDRPSPDFRATEEAPVFVPPAAGGDQVADTSDQDDDLPYI